MFSGILQASSSSEESESDSSDKSSSYWWISWFVAQPGNEFLLEIDEEFIRDNFNLYGLRPLFPNYDHSLEMILDPDSPDEEDLADKEYSDICKEAAELYGMIHQRFIMSPRGLSLLKGKFQASEFGLCPRTLCRNQPCLPVGISDTIREASVRIYCPKCEQTYAPRSRRCANVDGAYFGTSLPQMLLQTYPDLLPQELPVPFEAKIFGFRVHHHKSVIKAKLEQLASGVRPVRTLDLSKLPPDDFDVDSS